VVTKVQSQFAEVTIVALPLRAVVLRFSALCPCQVSLWMCTHREACSDTMLYYASRAVYQPTSWASGNKPVGLLDHCRCVDGREEAGQLHSLAYTLPKPPSPSGCATSTCGGSCMPCCRKCAPTRSSSSDVNRWAAATAELAVLPMVSCTAGQQGGRTRQKAFT
jgi:hypothetical protein